MMRRGCVALPVMAVLVLAYMCLEPHWLNVRHIQFVDTDVPEAFDGLRLVFLTDIHHGPWYSRERVRRLVSRVNALWPDLVLLGGDYVHQQSGYITPCFDELAGLRAPMGVFGVLGNHDHWLGARQTSEAMLSAGIGWLVNQSVWLERQNERIKLGGVDDFSEGVQRLGQTVDDTTESDLVLLLSHNPDYAEQISDRRVDLVLSGHTHGGQVTLFGAWAPLVPSRYGQKYRTGLVAAPQTQVLISNGVGTITPPLRFFARPEIVVVTLVRPN